MQAFLHAIPIYLETGGVRFPETIDINRSNMVGTGDPLHK